MRPSTILLSVVRWQYRLVWTRFECGNAKESDNGCVVVCTNSTYAFKCRIAQFSVVKVIELCRKGMERLFAGKIRNKRCGIIKLSRLRLELGCFVGALSWAQVHVESSRYCEILKR